LIEQERRVGRRIPETWKDEDEKEEDKREGHYSRETVLKKKSNPLSSSICLHC